MGIKKKSCVVELIEVDGELVIPLTPWIAYDLGWKVDDELVWKVLDDGTCIIQKVNEVVEPSDEQ